jgi:AcrR family transcriptional regulator
MGTVPQRARGEAPARRRTDRRDEILRVAARMFADRGFTGVSIDDLGAAVGLSGPALYRYFPGKESILAQMLVGISERLLDGGTRRVVESPDATAALTELIGFHVDFALDNPDLIAVQFRDLAHLPEAERVRVRRLQSRYVDLWVAALARRDDGIDPDRARASAHAVFGLINSTPHSARLSRPQMAALLRGMATAALAAARADSLS